MDLEVGGRSPQWGQGAKTPKLKYFCLNIAIFQHIRQCYYKIKACRTKPCSVLDTGDQNQWCERCLCKSHTTTCQTERKSGTESVH